MMRPTPPSGKGAPARLAGQRAQSGNAAAPPSHGSCYWQAVSDNTYLYAGPLGEIIGVAESGTVVREAQRFQDDFGGWWIAARASTPDVPNSDGVETPPPSSGEPTFIWLSYNASEQVSVTNLDLVEPSWVQVYPDNVSNDRNTSGSPRGGSALSASPRDGSSESGTSTGSLPTPKRPGVSRAKPALDSLTSQPKPIPAPRIAETCAAMQSAVTREQLLRFGAGEIAGVPSDIDLFSYYWDNYPQDAEALRESWNQRYQDMLEDVLFHESGIDVESQRRAQYNLSKLLDDFTGVCQQIAVAAVEQMLEHGRNQSHHCGSLPPLVAGAIAKGRIGVDLSPHPAFPTTVFFGEGLLLRLMSDTVEGYFGGETRAQKFAQKLFKGVKLLSLVGPRNLLCVPLSALVDFEGFRFLVTAIPPVHKRAGCVYSPCLRAAEQGFDHAAPTLVERLVKELAAALNLKEHTVPIGTTSSSVRSCLPFEVEIYAGRDRRLYLFGFHRVATCYGLGSLLAEGGRTGPQQSKDVVDLVLSSFRHEVTLAADEAANVDFGVSGCSTSEDLRFFAALTNYIRFDAITVSAGMIGMHVPLPASLRLPSVACNACQSTIESDELRFNVCRSAQACCHMCVRCYTKAVVESEKDTEKADAVLKAAVTCWHSSAGPRPLHAVVMLPCISDILHVNGLNMRYLAYVYHRLPTAARPFVAHFVEVEMVARAAVHLLRSALRGAAAPDDARGITEGFMSALLQTGGPNAERLWAKELGPLIERTFTGIVEPFSTRTLSRELLLQRVSTLSGVQFTVESIASFGKSRTRAPSSGAEGVSDDRPFLQLQAINPRVKSVSAVFPSLDDAARAEDRATEEVQHLRSLLEAVLLFWIGYTPSDPLDALQPRYLERVMSAAQNASA